MNTTTDKPLAPKSTTTVKSISPRNVRVGDFLVFIGGAVRNWSGPVLKVEDHGDEVVITTNENNVFKARRFPAMQRVTVERPVQRVHMRFAKPSEEGLVVVEQTNGTHAHFTDPTWAAALFTALTGDTANGDLPQWGVLVTPATTPKAR